MTVGSDRDSFLGELAATSPEAFGKGLAHAAEQLPRASITVDQRSRLLAQLDPYDRFGRFEAAVAELLHVTATQAGEFLRRIDEPSAWQPQAPGISYLPVQGAPGSEYFLSGFLRVEAGVTFPEHEHLGEEVTLVLQGALLDDQSGALFRPGEPSRMLAGTRHSFHVPAGGVHLVGLVTVKTGVRLVSPEVTGA